MEKLNLVNNLRQYRTAQNLTQEELASLVDVSRQTIIAIEKGDYVPSTLLSLSIAKALKVNINKLFYLSTEDIQNEK